MKKIITRVVAAVALMFTAMNAQAGPFQIGPVVGVNINQFTVDKTVFDASNRAGFTGGVMAKFTVPIINIGADLSVMYTRRGAEFTDVSGVTTKVNYDYLAIPLHVRYDLSLPAISRIIVPYVFTGPNFAFNVGKNTINDFKTKTCNMAWDFGLGFLFIKHLQINAGYSLGMNNAITRTITGTNAADIKGKTSGWTITAGWLF